MIKKFNEFIKESFEFQDVEVDDLNTKELCKYLSKLYTDTASSGLRHLEPGHEAHGIKCDEDGNILVKPLNILTLIFNSVSKRIFAIVGKGGLRQHKKNSVARLFDALQEKYFVLKDVYMDKSGNETSPDDENAIKCTELTLKAGPMTNRIFIVLIDFILNFKRSGKQLSKFHRRIPTMTYDLEHTDVNELEPDELMNYITNKYEFLNSESIFCTVDGNEYYYHIPVHNRDTDSFPIGNVSHLIVTTKNNNIIDLMLQIDGDEWGSSMEERSLLNIFEDKYRLKEDYICDGGVLGYYFDGDLGRHKFSNEFVLGIIDIDIENTKNPILQKK
jgi:hypothetical protein